MVTQPPLPLLPSLPCRADPPLPLPAVPRHCAGCAGQRPHRVQGSAGGAGARTAGVVCCACKRRLLPPPGGNLQVRAPLLTELNGKPLYPALLRRWSWGAAWRWPAAQAPCSASRCAGWARRSSSWGRSWQRAARAPACAAWSLMVARGEQPRGMSNHGHGCAKLPIACTHCSVRAVPRKKHQPPDCA